GRNALSPIAPYGTPLCLLEARLPGKAMAQGRTPARLRFIGWSRLSHKAQRPGERGVGMAELCLQLGIEELDGAADLAVVVDFAELRFVQLARQGMVGPMLEERHQPGHLVFWHRRLAACQLGQLV